MAKRFLVHLVMLSLLLLAVFGGGAAFAATPLSGDWSMVGTTGFPDGKSALAIAPDGTTYMALIESSTGLMTVRKYDTSSASWIIVGNTGFGDSSSDILMAVAPDGTPYVQYYDPTGIGETEIKFNGSAWVTVGSHNFSAFYNTMAIAPDGTPYVAYRDDATGYLCVMKFDGANWVYVGITNFGFLYSSPSLAFAADGTPHVAYSDKGVIRVLKFDAAISSWSSVGPGALSSGTAQSPSLAFAPDGTLYCAFNDQLPFSPGSWADNFATVMRFDGVSWVMIGQVDSGVAEVSAPIALAIAPDGTPYVAYMGGGLANVLTTMQSNGSSLVPLGTSDFPASLFGSRPPLVIAPNGSPYVSYVTDTGVTKVIAIMVASSLSVTTTTAPGAFTATAYSMTLAATGGSGTCNWSLASGTLPAGLTLNPATGVISGTPTSAGTSTFTVKVTDAAGATATKQLTLVVVNKLAISTSTLATAVTGSSYSSTLVATGGSGAYTWSLDSGTLPAGLNLNATTGVISGIPTTAGTSTFTVKVTDAGGNSVTKALTITVTSNLSVTTATLAGGAVAVAYSQSLTATGGSGAYSWSLSSGTLPAGLTLTVNGVISGAPTTAATSSITVLVTDAGGNKATKVLSIVVTAPALAISTVSLPNGNVAALYSQTFTATGGKAPYTWSRSAGTLPLGLTLSTTGVLSGTPTTAAASTFTIKVTDSAAASVTKSFTVTIAAAVKAVAVSTATLAGGTVGAAYSQTLAATGGTTPYSWSISIGTLPAGLTLNAATGVISGTPTVAATSAVTVKVTDGKGVVATKALSIMVAAAVTTTPDLTVTAVTGPTAITRGTTKYTFTSTVKNQGTAAAAASTVGFYLSTDTVIATTDVLVGSVSVGALAVGASQTVTLSVAVPTTVAATSYYVGALADSKSVVVESNETNNGKATTAKITVK
jgi:large repetitive protein